MTPDETLAARRDTALKLSALTILLHRAGGRLNFTEAEYQGVADLYGGTSKLAIHMEIVGVGKRPLEVQLRLIRKEPMNAELIV